MLIPGHKYGMLTAVAFSHHTELSRKAQWCCRCDCGTESIFDAYNVSSMHSQSCGCVIVEKARERMATFGLTHGHSPKGSPSRTYRSWQAMITRCHNPNAKYFGRYGGRGISVTKPWRESFESFLNDMGERPEGRTLDRIDGRFGYFASNCRWATPKEQANNKCR